MQDIPPGLVTLESTAHHLHVSARRLQALTAQTPLRQVAPVSLGRALGMSVLIEGVETEEQRVLLRLAGCTEMQGFLFAKPAPRAEVERFLAATPEGPALTAAKAG